MQCCTGLGIHFRIRVLGVCGGKIAIANCGTTRVFQL